MKRSKIPLWGIALAIVAVLTVVVVMTRSAVSVTGCAPSQYYCPGVGCLSGPDKCVAGSKGGPSAVFSKEAFKSWPGVGFTSTPPEYGDKEHFVASPPGVKSKCRGGTRTDGPCLMDFPDA